MGGFMSIVIVFGELLWDLFPNARRLGGAPANLAYRLHSMGADTQLVTRYGRDRLGARALLELLETRLPTDLFQLDDDLPTGTVEVEEAENGEPQYEIVPNVAYDRIELTDGMLKLASTAEAICFGTLIQRADTSRQTLYELLSRCQDAKKVVDINLRPKCFDLQSIRSSLRYADIVKVSLGELQIILNLLQIKGHTLAAGAYAIVETFGLSELIITNGDEGAMVFCDDGEVVAVPGFQIEFKNAVGAGDSFLAGYLRKRLGGYSIKSCCELGCLVGALVASKDGGMPQVTMDEIDALSRTAQRSLMAELDYRMHKRL
jgi:fructokinase